MDTDVLVVGAGPVGLLLAAELGLAGVNMTVVEELAEPNTAQKARGVGPLGAEALRRRGLGRRLDAHNRAGRAAGRARRALDVCLLRRGLSGRDPAGRDSRAAGE